jgi:hypothetical protein
MQMAILPGNSQNNPIIEVFLIRPIAKIRLIWTYFKKEPDTGFFWECQTPIGGQIEPG